MENRTRCVMAFIPALLACACDQKTESGRGQAEATPAAAGQTGSAKLHASAAEEAQLLSRWNAVARDDTVDVGGFLGRVHFHWERFDKFPHPTFKGGNEAAYAKFFKLLAAFFQNGDNFDYLLANGLLTVELRYVFEGGHTPFQTTFAKLSHSGDWPLDEETRQVLKSFSERIDAAAKK